MNIDREKLRAAIREINQQRKGGNRPKWPDSPTDWRDAEQMKAYRAGVAACDAFNNQFNAYRATQLYSLKAHLRGKLHITKRWFPNFQEDGGRILTEQGVAEQEALIAPLLKEFELKEAA